MTRYFTRQGFENHLARIKGLEAALDKLQADMSQVMSAGNTFHDNAFYDHLVEDIRVADSRLSDAHMLSNDAGVIDAYPKFDGTVCLGTSVKISVNGEVCQYEVVAYGEAELDKNRVLYDSPIITAIVGKRAGERTFFNLGSDRREVEILEVQPLK